MARSNRLKCFLLALIFITGSSGFPQMKPYKFAYNVNDTTSGNDFGHGESSDGQLIRGQYHVLLPDGQRQTVTYTADALNGYQAKVEVSASTFEDSMQQVVNRHLEFISQRNELTSVEIEELRNIVEILTDSQDTDRSRTLTGCSEIMKNRFSECLTKCSEVSCWSRELSNFKSACDSSNLQTCTPNPNSKVKCGIENSNSGTSRASARRIKNSGSDSGRDSTRRKENSNSDSDRKPTRIVNGVEVKPERKYSWQVGLKQDPMDLTYNCGGSIITNRHILTAAHCVVDIDEVYVGIGDHRQLSIDDNLPDFKDPILSKNIIIHEDYIEATLVNDIAIIELSTPIDLEKHAEDIHPICLPADDSKTYAGLTATVSGWGSTIGYSIPLPPGVIRPPTNFPDILQETRVPVLKNSICKTQVENSLLHEEGFRIKDTNICGATEDFRGELTGDCQGDSGGPLYVKENEKHEQIGIVSFGLGCASQGNPGVYTRVSKFLPWIKIQVESEIIYTRV